MNKEARDALFAISAKHTELAGLYLDLVDALDDDGTKPPPPPPPPPDGEGWLVTPQRPTVGVVLDINGRLDWVEVSVEVLGWPPRRGLNGTYASLGTGLDNIGKHRASINLSDQDRLYIESVKSTPQSQRPVYRDPGGWQRHVLFRNHNGTQALVGPTRVPLLAVPWPTQVQKLNVYIGTPDAPPHLANIGSRYRNAAVRFGVNGGPDQQVMIPLP